MKKQFSNIIMRTFIRTLVLMGILVICVTDIKGQITYPYSFTYNGNPLERNHGASDPSVHVWDGTVWMYTSKDHAPGYSAMDGYHAYSSTDLVHWTDYGDVFNSSMLKTSSWGTTQRGWMWAPGAARKQDANGVWTYYLYYPHNKAAVGAGEDWVTGVATAPNPWGPFTDQGILGGYPSWKAAMDPMVFIDDDGQAYIYANSLKVAKLNPDMVSLAESPRSIVYDINNAITDPYNEEFGEGSYMHKKDGVYYYSYSNFHGDYQGFYAVGGSPYGPFVWKGPMAPHPVGAQDHHSVIEFKGQWYYFYHISLSNIPAVKDGQSRIACFDKLFYNPDGTIKLVKETQGPTFMLSTNATNGYIKTDTPGPVYEAGTSVTLTGIGDLGYAFNSWSGDLTGTTNPAKIIMNADKNITASFIPVPICTLSTSVTNGLITMDPLGGVYSKGVVVTLTATSNLGYAFSNWSGDITGTMNPATIIMDRNKGVTANFTAAPTFKLITHAENGSIILNPIGGIYNGGTKVEVKAKADPGFVFTGWSGDPLKNEYWENPNFITMDSDKSITANFMAPVGAPVVSFIKPLDGAKFEEPANLSVTVDAKDPGGSISNVKLYLNGVFVRQENTAPYEWSSGDLALQNLPKGTYVLKADATDNTGKIGTKSITITVGNVTSIHQEKMLPHETALMQNYPNPFNPETNISYQLAQSSEVKLLIFNSLGQRVSTLVEKNQPAGFYTVKWQGTNDNGRAVPSGVYFYRLEANHFVQLKKYILLR